MIREMRGTVLSLSPEEAIVDVGGWGVRVLMSSTTGLMEGEETRLVTHLAVKQDGIELYGFKDEKDLEFFEQCLNVPGVGPKTALSFLRRAPREALKGAIAKRDVSYLTKVAGLGKKSAEKMIVELVEKMKTEDREHEDGDTEVFETLVALGYSEREARRALNSVPDSVSGKDARLKAALQAKGA